MKGVVLFIVIVGLAVLPYILRRVLRSGMNKAEDAFRNRRIDRERQEGKPNKVERLADRYNLSPAPREEKPNQNFTPLEDRANQGFTPVGNSVKDSAQTSVPETKFCASCGRIIPANAAFCSYCGEKVID